MTDPASQSFYPNRAKLGFFFLGGIALFFTCLWIVLNPEIGSSIKELIAGWVGVPFFGIASVYLLVRLIRHRPSVVLDVYGIHDNASILNGGFIPWKDVASAEVFDVKNQAMVGIALKNNDVILAHAGLLRKVLAKANLAMGLPLITIPESAINVKADELVSKISKLLAAHKL